MYFSVVICILISIREPKNFTTNFFFFFCFRFLTFCYLAALNCWLLLFPATLSHDWQMGSVPLVTCFADSRNLATCLFFGCLVVLIYKGIIDFEVSDPFVRGKKIIIQSRQILWSYTQTSRICDASLYILS